MSDPAVNKGAYRGWLQAHPPAPGATFPAPPPADRDHCHGARGRCRGVSRRSRGGRSRLNDRWPERCSPPRVDYEPQVTLKGFPFDPRPRRPVLRLDHQCARCPDRRLRHPRRLSRGDERGHGGSACGPSGFRFDFGRHPAAADDVAASVSSTRPTSAACSASPICTSPPRPNRAGGVGGPGDGVLSVRTGGVDRDGRTAATPPGGLPTSTSSPSASGSPARQAVERCWSTWY